jgi:C2 domain
MWVEIYPTSIPMNEIPLWNITPKPPDYFEVRVVIYDTEDLVANDPEGCSDVYCRAFFDSKEDAKETDTHYRCSNGKASFNYRLLYTLAHPRKDYTLTVQLYDRDLLSSNDIMGEASINIKDALIDAALTKKPVAISKKYYNSYLKNTKSMKLAKMSFKDENSFFLTCKGGKPGKDGKFPDQGKVRIQIDILPKDHADKNKVGEARQEPNHSPTLKEPEGRLSLEMNPIKMALAMVGPDLRRKIIMALLCGFCIFLCVMLLPLIAGNIISDLLMKMIGLG